MPRSSRLLAALGACLAFASTPPSAHAQNQGSGVVETSACYAFARNFDQRPPVVPARLAIGELTEDQVAMQYVGHSTFLLQTAKGVTVATDYAGWAGRDVVPMIVTMNGAHSTHYTNHPSPEIVHVLRGWPQNGAPADFDLTVEDLRIRNVTTDVIRGSLYSLDGDEGGGRQADGNSIFVFEVADLCIGHLGHLHHPPTPEQYSKIGFLDVVMAPIDGVYTISLPLMIEILQNLRARVVIPMHYFGPSSLTRFVEGMRVHFDVKIADPGPIVLSDNSLPRKPTVLVLAPSSPIELD